MNQLQAKVTKIQGTQGLKIVTFHCANTSLKMMSLDLQENIHDKTVVQLTCKPTSIAIAKNFSGELSYANQLNAVILSLELGELLCSIQLQFTTFTLESIITADSASRLRLAVGDEVTALIKASDLSIAKVIS
ncbi:TOBE domain-containing protein [Sulfurimonas sp.]|uniref:TOBE domain-containing protein n=1 Tax=Sulfurimonas sp. TaxID=2022749 RepID=UPI002622D31B|nr:TOBE domain-containing protein [Sulfurimonas sp.]